MKRILNSNVLVLVVAAVSLCSAPAFAKSVVSCTNGGDKVSLSSISNGEYKASVTVELAGGAVRSRVFRGIEHLQQSRVAGAPSVFQGPNFKLSIFSEGSAHAILEVPTLSGDAKIELDECGR